MEYLYPLTDGQRKLSEKLNNDEVLNLNASVEEILSLCSTEDTGPLCDKHEKQARDLQRRIYLEAPNGSWKSYRNPSYFENLRNMFDSMAPIKEINARQSRELRSHHKDSACTPQPGEPPEVTEFKREAAAMFDSGESEDKIDQWLRQRQAPIMARVNDSPGLPLKQSGFNACLTETKKHEFLRVALTKYDEKASKFEARQRDKAEELFDSGKSYREIVVILEKDATVNRELRKKITRQVEDIKRGQAAQEKEVQNKENQRIAKKARLYASFSTNCNNPECSNLCIPVEADRLMHPTGCDLCKRDSNARLRGSKRSYWCSEFCSRNTIIHHMKTYHKNEFEDFEKSAPSPAPRA